MNKSLNTENAEKIQNLAESQFGPETGKALLPAVLRLAGLWGPATENHFNACLRYVPKKAT